MPRLLVNFDGVVRRVASVEIAHHDGSINLSLVRSGTNQFGWTCDSTRAGFEMIHDVWIS